MYKLMYVSGTEMIHSMWFKPSQTNNCIGMLVMVKDSVVISTDKEFRGSCALIVVGQASFQKSKNNGAFSRYDVCVMPKDWRNATNKEINKYNAYLKEYNMVWDKRVIKHDGIDLYNGCKHFVWENECENLFYISKDNMRIRVNGELILYKDLKAFDKGLNVILGGDNGYSYCWEKSVDANKVFNCIENIFKDSYTNEMIGKDGMAQYGECFGWSFNENGELILNLTTKNVNYSQVSNS